ncbi:MAG: hypothetical protein LUC43_02190, partial [Burkholderiales bacterium]|nr:hypothetical protein [Burkholderiales bacterium]
MMQRKIKEFTSYITKFSKKAIWVLAIGAAGTSVAQTQSELGPNYFGTPMFSYWEEADLAKSGTKGYFGGRLTLPQGAEKWPEEFREQLKQYKISHFSSRQTINQNEVPDEINSF